MFLVLRALDNNLKYSTRTSLLRGCTTVGRRTVTGSSSLCKTHYCWILFFLFTFHKKSPNVLESGL